MTNMTVTSPLLPNLEEFNEMLKEIWSSKWVANMDFNSVGLSYIDINFANYIFEGAKKRGLGKDIIVAESAVVDYAALI